MISYFILGVFLLLVSLESIRSDSNNNNNNNNNTSSSVDNDHWAVRLFGTSLYQWQNSETFAEKSTLSLLKDKEVVAIYFSASW